MDQAVARSTRVTNLRIVLAAIAVGVLYNLPGWLVPELTQGIIDRFHMPAAAAGLIPTVENLTAGLLSLFLASRGGAGKLRSLTIGALLLWFVGNMLTYVAIQPSGGLVLLGISRFMVGSGSGLMIFISTTLAAATARPERTFGQTTVAANAFAALALTSLPWALPNAGPLVSLPYASVLALIWIPLTLLQPRAFMPASQPREAEDVESSVPVRRCPPIQVAGLLIAMNAMTFLNLGNFIFSIQLGLRAGMTAAQVQSAMGTAMFVSTAGALAVSLLPRRAGYVLPLCITILCAMMTNYLEVTTLSGWTFGVALALSQILAFFMVPVFLGFSAALDPSGGMAGILNSSFVLNYALCPALVGYLVDRFTLTYLPGQTVLLALVALACVLMVRASQYRRANGEPVPSAAE